MADIIPFRQPQRECRVLVASAAGRTRDKLIADATIAGYEVQVCADLAAAADHLSQIESDICLIDLDESPGDVTAFCRSSPRWRQPVTLIGLASRELLDSVGVDAEGKLEIIPKPCPPARLVGRLQEASKRLKLKHENEKHQRRSRRRLFEEFVGCSDAADSLRESMLEAAAIKSPIIVTGSRGSGTTLVARAVHLLSDRADQPLITIDCSLQSSVALEQELVGTMQHGMSIPSGLLHQAAGGTLIFENLDAVPLPLQKKLVDVIGRAIAEEHPLNQHVRVIAVIKADPESQVQRGQLDSRLWKLLNGQTIVVPSLGERSDDVLPLAEHFLHRLSLQEGRPARQLSFDAKQLLTTHQWTGNVVQLWNVVQRAASVDSTGLLTADSLLPWIDDKSTADVGGAEGMTLRDMERKLIETTFNRYCGNREQTAHALKIGLRTLSGKLRDYGYPPRGGPGSNLKPASQQKAA